MKLSLDLVSQSKGLVSVALICALTAASCGKKEDTTDENKDENPVKVTTNTALQTVQCNDPVALTQLSQSIKSNLNSQTQSVFNAYAESAGETLSLSNLNNAVGSILIDVANPIVLQKANDQGMVTCSASLSLTLPNQDIARATKVYNSLENRNLKDLLLADNITLNNNMLVSNNFNYVVGMQGGRTTSRIVGQPVILAAVSDIIAKSQFQATLNVDRTASRVVQPRPAPAEPSTRNEPRVRPEPEQRPLTSSSQNTNKPSTNNSASNRGSADNSNTSKPTANAPANAPTNSPTNKPANAPASNNSSKPSEPKVDNKAPQNDDIEMVIIEDEGTY